MGLRKELEQLLNNSDSVFKESWETLCYLKEPKNSTDIGQNLVDFQIKLATILFEIERFRQKVSVEEKKIKKNQKRYNYKWFVNKLKTFAHYKKILIKFTVIGKSIGDAFVFCFYRFDLQLLSEHFNHRRTLHMPLGIGGTGELEFIRRMRLIDGKMTIYHGITNILRIGDVSFFDMENLHIASIGEIKTKKAEDNKITINLIMLGPKDRKWFKNEEEKEIKPLDIDYFDKDRLERQLKSMSEALKVYIPSDSNQNSSQDIEEEYYCKFIEKLYSISSYSKLTFIQASEGLLYAGIKSKSKNAIVKYLNPRPNKIPERDIKTGTDFVTKIIKKSSSQNGLIYSRLQYGLNDLDNLVRGAIPLFWMPINNEILKDLYFEDFQVVSLFNPVHLIERLITKGIIVKSKYYDNDQQLSETKKPRITAEYFDLYIPFITSFLQTENSIVIIFDLIETEYFVKEDKVNTRIEIKMQQFVEKYMFKPSR